jgi:hypothetical protein
MRRRHEELREHPLALQIDDLPRFAERESHRIVVRGERVGADEAVLLVHAADLALDDPRRLVLTFALVGLGADDEALVFDRLRNLCRLDVRKANRALRNDITCLRTFAPAGRLLPEHDPEKPHRRRRERRNR